MSLAPHWTHQGMSRPPARQMSDVAASVNAQAGIGPRSPARWRVLGHPALAPDPGRRLVASGFAWAAPPPSPARTGEPDNAPPAV